MSLFNFKAFGITAVIALIVIAGVIGISTSTAAQRSGSGGSIDGRIKDISPSEGAYAYVYYKALRTCFTVYSNRVTNQSNTTIRASDAQSLQWFGSGFADPRSTNVGVLGDPRPAGNGQHTCYGEQGETIIRGLMNATGYDTGPELLCAIGFEREADKNRCTTITGGLENGFVPPSQAWVGLDNWWSGVIGATESVSSLGPGAYILYYESFADESNPCGVRDWVASDGGSFDYEIGVPSTDGRSLEPKKFVIAGAGFSRDTSLSLYDQRSINCGELTDALERSTDPQSFARLYESWLSQSPGNAYNPEPTSPDETTETDESTSCVVDQVGWMICPILNLLGGLNDALYGWIESVLILNPLTQTDEAGEQTPQYQTWQAIRNLANIILVVIFLIIIFSQLTSIGVSNYGVKKLLPRLVVVAILINLSYLLMQVSIDLTNLIGVGIKTILDSTAVSASMETLDFNNVVGSIVTGSAISLAVGGTAVAVAAGAGIGLSAFAILALPFIATAALSLLAAVATLFLRNALIIVLVVISPLAIAAYLLPNTEGLFDKWRKLFISMLVLFPMAALLFGAAKFAAYITLTSTQPFSVLVALFLMAAPLGALPFLVRSSNSILSGVGNKLQGLAKAARNPMQRGLKDRLENSKAAYSAGSRNWLGMKRANPSSRRTLAQRGSDTRRARQLDTSNLEATGEERFKEAALNRTDKTSVKAARVLDAQQTLSRRKGSNEAAFKERSDLRAADASTEDATYARRQYDADLGSKMAQARTKATQLGRTARNEVSTTSGMKLGDTALETSKAELSGAVSQGRLDLREAKAKTVGGAMFQDEIMRRGLAQAADAKTKRVDQFQAEASTDSDAKYLNFAGKEARGLLQDSELELQITRDATGRAQGVAQQEYAEKVQTDPALAKRAAGIDSVYGPTRVVAQATQVVNKANQDAVAAETVLIKDKRVPTGSLLTSFVGGKNPTDPLQEYTPEQAQAMVKMIVESGTVDEVHALYEHMNGPGYDDAKPENQKALQVLGETLASTKRLRSIGQGTIAELSNGKKDKPFMEVVAGRVAGGKYSPEAIAGMDAFEVKQLVDYFNASGSTVPADQKDAVKQAIAGRMSLESAKTSVNKEAIDALKELTDALK